MINYNLEEILPHDHPMILIDRVLDVNWDEKYLVSSVKITEDKIFYDKSIGGISPIVGIEFMAQTIGCFAHIESGAEEPKIGFLLGTRLYNNSLEYFKNGETYQIKVTEVYTDQEMAVFDCIIYDENQEECANATLNVYQGDNVEKVLTG